MLNLHYRSQHDGYFGLIRRNRNFRFLWLGQLTSNLGDWFSLIASASLISELTEVGLAIGLLFMVRTLAPFLAGPMGGVIADRYNRRNIIILATLLRVPIIFAFLLARTPKDVWLLYLLTALQLFLSGIFFPTRSAILPDIVNRQEIRLGNAILGTTFAVMLAVGSALGGFFSGIMGIYPSFIVNGFAYFLSALFLVRIRIKEPHIFPDMKNTPINILSEYYDGIRYMVNHSYLFVLALHKAFGGLLLGATFEVVQVAIAQRVFIIGENGGSSTGLMFAISGVGLMFSTLVLPYFVTDSIPRLVWIITLGYLIGSLGLALNAILLNLGLTLVGTFFRGIGNGIVYLFSTQLILQLVPTQVRGRVVATEYAFSMLISAIGSAFVGRFLDSSLGISGVVWIMAGITLVPGILWTLWSLSSKIKPMINQNTIMSQKMKDI